MIAGIGVDIVKTERFINAPEKLISQFLGWNETQEYEKRNKCPRYLATRFAAKEAFLKALGAGIAPIANLNMIELVNDDSGRPYFALNGWIYNHIKQNHFHPSVSLSDETDSVVAFVIIEKRKR